MIVGECSICPKCGGPLKYHDTVSRVVRMDYGKVTTISVKRMRCSKCGSKHRVVPNNMLPYKHYKAEIIYGFVAGTLTTNDLAYEDYPCETTIKNWIYAHKKQLLLRGDITNECAER